MKCVNCGSELPENAMFCSNCGVSIEKTGTEVKEESSTEKVNEVEINIDAQNQIDNIVEQNIDNNSVNVSENINNINNNSILQQNNSIGTENLNNIDPKKKDMSKVYMILGIVGIIALFAVICLFVFKKENKDVDSIIKAASNHFEKLDNYKMELSANIKMKAEGMSYSMGLSGDMSVDEKNQSAKMDIKVSMLGMEMSTVSYTEKDGDNFVTYTQDMTDQDLWTKSVSETTDFNDSIKEIESFISKATNYEIVSSDEKGLTKIKVVVDSKKIMELMNEMDLEDYDAEDFEFEKDLVLYIYTDKSNHYSKIKIDLLENIDLSELEDGVSISECVIEFNFSDYNKVGDITVPSDIKEKAVEEDELDYDYDTEVDYTYYEPEDYMDEIVYSAESYCYYQNDFGGAEIDFSKYNDELELDFDAPNQGIISIDSDCNVTIKSNVIIDGKSCTYSDYTSTCK